MEPFEVQNIYGTPQIPRKKPCIRPRRMTLIDLRNVRVDEEDEPYRKSSTATIRSEGTGTQYYSSKHGGVLQMYDSSDNSSLDSHSTISAMRIRRVSSSFDGSTRFPKLQECAHFHYDQVELRKIKVLISDEDQENYLHNGEDFLERTFLVKVIATGDKSWSLRRTFRNFRSLDRQLHKCIYDRKFSKLPNLNQEEDTRKSYKDVEDILRRYLDRFSAIAGSMINCGSVLNWFELDNRGNRLLAVDDSGINTPAIAAAHAVKRYTAQAADEISLEVGDIVSVIDMPTQDETIWWRGKRGFEVGFFPSECVEVIGDKVPASVENRIPLPSASRKPLVRKHGKFLSFLRMFFFTRPARNQLKQSGIVKERVFGCDLGEHLLNSGHDVPLVLKSCSEIIEKHGIVDGIYRLSGITSNIQKLRLAFDEDKVPDLTADIYLQDIHSISSLLKMYFRELPNPLLTYQLYDKFADAVRDEDNKLWKIHDVVQQLPPPHYRTTEYLMRHLAKVAAYGPDTGMHSKNLAIVWAPNLLRSKELESGGGAAALQGVGIQAVVTECLILYADLIFSDKMPAYSSPELHSSHKKPRPKSLAISTPTKLITLEEARERALSASLHPSAQKYIDVGGGPESLPSRYHTVIDLPGYKKKTNMRDTAGYSKVKKSPSGWRSIFSRSTRQNSIKQKGRKNSIGEPLPLGDDRKAITEEDVHNWKRRRLRGAKSAESLLAMTMSGIDSNRLSRQFEDSAYRLQSEVDTKPPVKHKRSLSSESPRTLIHTNHAMSYPSFIMAGEREMAIDVDSSLVDDTCTPTENEKHIPNADNRAERKQSFVRGDNKRRVITHRRTPSAPSTPRQDEDRSDDASCRSKSPSCDKKTASQQALDSSEIKQTSDRSKTNHTLSAGRLDFNSADSDKFVLHVTDTNLFKTADGKSLSYSPEEGKDKKRTCKTPPSPRDVKTRQMPPSPRGKYKEDKHKEKNPHKENIDSSKVVTIDLPESPGAKRKNWMGSGSNTPAGTPDEPPSSSHFYYSRHHDYAEILSDEDKEGNHKKNEIVAYADVLRNYSDTDFPHVLNPKEDIQNNRGGIEQYSPMEITLSNQNCLETTFLPNSNESIGSQNLALSSRSAPSSQSPNLARGIPRPPREINTPFVEKSHSHSVGQSPSDNPDVLLKMSKCLSVPADIQKSLENMTYNGSQSDMLSSVTISELSASADSFNVNFKDDFALTCRRRRSASVDSIGEVESPLTRTLREINAQIDKAFKHEVSRAQMLQEGDRGTANRSRSGSFDNIRSDSLDSMDNAAGVNFIFQRHDNIIPPLPSNDDTKTKQTFVERPAVEVQVVETPRLIRAPLRSSNTQQPSYSSNQQVSSSKNSASLPQHIISSQHIASSQNTSFSQHGVSSQYTTPSPQASTAQHVVSSQHMSPSQQVASAQHLAFSQHVASSQHREKSSRHMAPSSLHIAPSSQHLTSSQEQFGASSDSKMFKALSPIESANPQACYHEDKLLHNDASSPMTPSEELIPGGIGDDVVVKSRHQDSRMIRSDSRHGRVEFDLSDEDLDFLSRQGILQDMKNKLKERGSKVSSPQSPIETVQWSPEVIRSPGFHGVTSPSSPPTKKASDVSASHGSSEDMSKIKGHSVHRSKPPARREFAKLLLESEVESGSGSTKSSPRSPRQQPRWEDLAGLNQDFGALAGLKSSKAELATTKPKLDSEGRKASVESDVSMPEEASFERKLQDLSDFNEIWRQQLAPTGDVCRSGSNDDSKGKKGYERKRPPLKKSSTIGAMELSSSEVRRERTPECGTEDQTVTLEKPMIKKCLTESDLPQIKHCSIMTQDSQSTTSSSGTSEALSEVHNISDRLIMEKPSIRRGATGMSDPTNCGRVSAKESALDKLNMSVQVCEEEKSAFPKPRKIQKMDSFEYVGNSGLERMDTSDNMDNQYNQSVVMATSQRSHSALSSKSNSVEGMMTSNKVNTTETMLTSNHDGQIKSEVFMYSESSRSATGESSSQPFNPIMNDIDINESCFGIPTHQNLSNEFREKMQERLKSSSQQGSLETPNLGGMETLQMAESYMYQEQSEHAVHVGYSGPEPISQGQGHRHESQRMELETTRQMSPEAVTVPEPSSITLPLENITSLSQGPMVMATPGAIEALDNTEEAAQNAINDDLELSMSLKSPVNSNQPENINQRLDLINYGDDDDCCSANKNVITPSVHGILEPLGMYKPCDNITSWQQNLLPLPELAPPEREFMEVNRPCVIKSSKLPKRTDSSSKSDSANNALKGQKSSHVKSKIPVKGDHYRHSSEKEKSSERGDKFRKPSKSGTGSGKGTSKKESKSSERGESILVERKSSLKKKKMGKTCTDNAEGNEFDVNDDVFVDPKEIKCETSVHTSGGDTQHKSVSDKRSVLHSFLNDPPNRSSLDESILQVASTRHDDFLCEDFNEDGEDIRFTRAHRSTKLKSLRELFEKTNEQEKESKSKLKKKVSSSSQEKLVCLPKSQMIESTTFEIEEKESPRLKSARNAFASHRSYSHTEKISYPDSEMKESYISTSARNSPLIGRGAMAIPYDDWQMPRSRRSISTDVGYELGPRPRDNLLRDHSWDRQCSFTNASKPPKHRSGSRTRTASESSVSESENYRMSSTKNSPKSPRQDGSPKSPHQDSSPKSGRESSISAKNSPKTQRFEEGSIRSGTESPLFHRAGDDISFHSHRTRQRSDGSPKIIRKVSFGKSDTHHSQESSPKSPRTWGSPSNRRSLSMESSLVIEGVNKEPKSSDKMSVSCTGSLPDKKGSAETVGRELERRGSIKELRDFFEQKLEEGNQDDTSVMSASVESVSMRSSRVRSVSPTTSGSRLRESLESVNVRHSLELPSGGSSASQIESMRSQPLRLGPKPFYGARK